MYFSFYRLIKFYFFVKSTAFPFIMWQNDIFLSLKSRYLYYSSEKISSFCHPFLWVMYIYNKEKLNSRLIKNGQ